MFFEENQESGDEEDAEDENNRDPNFDMIFYMGKAPQIIRN